MQSPPPPAAPIARTPRPSRAGCVVKRLLRCKHNIDQKQETPRHQACWLTNPADGSTKVDDSTSKTEPSRFIKRWTPPSPRWLYPLEGLPRQRCGCAWSPAIRRRRFPRPSRRRLRRPRSRARRVAGKTSALPCAGWREATCAPAGAANASPASLRAGSRA